MQAPTFIAMCRTPEALKEIKDALTASMRARLLTDCNDPDRLLADCIRLCPSAAIVVFDSDNQEMELALIKQLTAARPETTVIAAAYDASPSLILGSMRAGAREFLQLPIDLDEFKTVVHRTKEFNATVQSKALGRIVAVFSAKGGTGVSFLATNLAATLNLPTVLVDLNLQTGDAASFLGLTPKYSLLDLVRNRFQLDDSLLTSIITPHSSHLSLLAAPLEAHEAEDIKPEHITEALHLLSQKFECIVLDLQHIFDPVTVAALDLADDILLLMTLAIPDIRSTKRALKVFERLGYPRSKVRVVINRWSKNVDVELQKVQTHLDEQVIAFVPNDYGKVIDSLNLGRPLVETDPASKIAQEIKSIAGLFQHKHGTTPPQPRKGIAGLFERKHETASPQPRKGVLGVFDRQRSRGRLDVSVIPDTV